VEEYLSIESVAKRLELTPKSVKNKMAQGVFKLGVHYFRPPGLGPRFKWSAVVAWMGLSDSAEQTPETPRPPKVHTYFIHAQKLEAVKIGKSGNPTERFKGPKNINAR